MGGIKKFYLIFRYIRILEEELIGVGDTEENERINVLSYRSGEDYISYWDENDCGKKFGD